MVTLADSGLDNAASCNSKDDSNEPFMAEVENLHQRTSYAAGHPIDWFLSALGLRQRP